MKEGMKKALLTFAAVVFAGLTYVFFAVENVFMGEGDHTIGTTGFDLYEGGSDFMKAMLILTCIFVGLTVLFGLIKLVTDSKMVKSKSASKIVNFIFVVSAIAMVVCAVLYTIAIASMCNDTTLVGDYRLLNPTVWSLVLLAVFPFIGLVLGMFSLQSKKK